MAHAEDWQRLHLEDLAACLNTLADALSVTSSALRWRLVALGKLRPVQAGAIPEAALRNNGRPTPPGDLPDLFSEQFMDVLGRAIGQGSVSVHRIADLLNLSIEALAALLARHGIKQALDL